jgi:glycosyltransferase involved in cell wall biosynthesis
VKIVHINAHESSGGAARAANRLHRGLRAQGQDSSMYVARRDTGDRDVVMFQPPNNLSGLLRRAARWLYLRQDFARIKAARRLGDDILSPDRTLDGAEPLRQLPKGDILHLHWVAKFVDYEMFLPGAAKSAPLVWTLHDMNPFTGGCHYDESCGRHLLHCGECPLLGSREATDLTNKIWTRKRNAYATISRGRLHVITPSQWLASEARRSALFSGFPVSVIPYGLDVAAFSPGDRRSAREYFGVPNDKLVILCVADSLKNPRKGMGPLREALAGLKDHPDFLFATLGLSVPLQDLGMPHMSLGYLNDDHLVSLAYNAADVVVCPSLQDNLPNTILESMACGVPVVGFNVGGIPDMVREGITGNLVPVGDITGLRDAIVGILRNRARQAAMAANCRRVAVEEYSLEIQVRRYINLYETILGKN